MKSNSKTLVIIPCYNEAERLPKGDFIKYLNSNRSENISLLFVNDGSTDNTQNILNFIKATSKNVSLLTLKNNSGKGEAIRQGMLKSLESDVEYVGFLDADLAAPIKEIEHLLHYTHGENKPLYIFGARVKLLGFTNIRRSTTRHYFGRVFATIVSKMLRLPIYDTQCGVKLIESSIIKDSFKDPFISKWLFDVEILFRLKKMIPEKIETRILEIPLNTWEEKHGSKISPFYLIKVPFELMKIYFHYNK